MEIVGRRISSTPVPFEGRHKSAASTPCSYVNLSFSSSELGQMDVPGNPIRKSKLTSKESLFVSERLRDWRRLLRHLFEETDEDVDHLIEGLEHDQNSQHWNLQEVAARALNKWKQKRSGIDYTFEKLAEALQKIGEKELCKEFLLQRGYRWDDAHITVFLEEKTCQKVANEQRPSEVQEILTALNGRNKRIISLAGHAKSGRTIILDILQRELTNFRSFDRTKILRINISGLKDMNSLTRNIVEKITQQPQLEGNYRKKANKLVFDLTELDAYDDVLLILNISFVPMSKTGQSVIDFIYDLLNEEKVKNKLTIMVTTLCSLAGTKLFVGNTRHSQEVTVKPMKQEKAVKFLRDVNNDLPWHAAELICKKIECFPSLLNKIGEVDIESFFAVKGKDELLKAIDCRFGDLIEKICSNFEGKRMLQEVFDCLDNEQKSLLAQALAFSNEFDIERASRVVQARYDISDMSFIFLCDKGVLFFMCRSTKTSQSKIYTIPTMLGRMLRSIIQDDEKLNSEFQRAEQRHQSLFHSLLLFMGRCFLGDAPGKNVELKILEPFTPSDGVPAKYSLTIPDMNERVTRVNELFREHVGDIKNSVKVRSNQDGKYKAALSVVTDLNVYYMFSKFLRFHEVLEIYRSMKRKARDGGDLDTDKLNVFIAACLIDSYGFKWFSSEAKSLLEAANLTFEERMRQDNHAGLDEIHAFCLLKLGTCFLAESLMNKEDELLFSQGMELLKRAENIFKEQLAVKCTMRAFITEINFVIAAFKYEMGKCEEALEIMNEEDLKSCPKRYGRIHPLSCGSMRLRGMLLRKKGDFEFAKQKLLEVFDAEVKLLKEHTDTAKTLSELGICNIDEFHSLNMEEEQLTVRSVPTDMRKGLSMFLELDHTEHIGTSPRSGENVSEDFIDYETANGGVGGIRSAAAENPCHIRTAAWLQTSTSPRMRSGSEPVMLLKPKDGDKKVQSSENTVTRKLNRQSNINIKSAVKEINQNTSDKIMEEEAIEKRNRYANADSIDELTTEDVSEDAGFVTEGKPPQFLRINSSSTASLSDAKQSKTERIGFSGDYPDGARNQIPTMTRLKIEGPKYDLLTEAKSYFKKAARYYLNVVGKRDGACENLDHLAEVCGLLGDDEEQQKWQERANEYRACIIRISG